MNAAQITSFFRIFINDLRVVLFGKKLLLGLGLFIGATLILMIGTAIGHDLTGAGLIVTTLGFALLGILIVSVTKWSRGLKEYRAHTSFVDATVKKTGMSKLEAEQAWIESQATAKRNAAAVPKSKRFLRSCLRVSLSILIAFACITGFVMILFGTM